MHDLAWLQQGFFPVQVSGNPGKHPGSVPCRSTQHDAIKTLQLGYSLIRLCQPAIQHKDRVRKINFELVGDVVPQWRDFSVGLGRQSLEHRVTGMDDKYPAANPMQPPYEISHKAVRVIVVQA